MPEPPELSDHAAPLGLLLASEVVPHQIHWVTGIKCWGMMDDKCHSPASPSLATLCSVLPESPVRDNGETHRDEWLHECILTSYHQNQTSGHMVPRVPRNLTNCECLPTPTLLPNQQPWAGALAPDEAGRRVRIFIQRTLASGPCHRLSPRGMVQQGSWTCWRGDP